MFEESYTMPKNPLDPKPRKAVLTKKVRPAPITPAKEQQVRNVIAKAYTKVEQPEQVRLSRRARTSIFQGDAEFIDEATRYQDITTREWAGQVNLAILTAIRFITRAAVEGNPKNSRVVLAVATALKIVNEADLTRRVIDAKLAEHYRHYGGEDFQVPEPIKRGREIITRRPIQRADADVS